MPCSPAKARHLLKAGKAKVVRRTPFTIKLTIATGETKQPVSLGVDAGYKHVGLSASTAKAALYASEVELRQDITELLSERRALRRSRRYRKTRYRAPRFDNRVHSKHKGWLAPSVENRINAHHSRIEEVLKLLPVTKITVETAAFDTQLLKNPEIQGEEYQQGEQTGFWNVREYVLFRDNHVCQHCTAGQATKCLTCITLRAAVPEEILPITSSPFARPVIRPCTEVKSRSKLKEVHPLRLSPSWVS